jgi:hypothetical protein
VEVVLVDGTQEENKEGEVGKILVDVAVAGAEVEVLTLLAVAVVYKLVTTLPTTGKAFP